METVSITIDEKKVFVEAPFDRDFVDAARGLGGKWDKNEKHPRTWEFSLTQEQRVRDICLEVYGTDGAPTTKVTLNCHLDYIHFGSEFMLGGRSILKKWDRDRAPQVGEGCAVIAGKLKARGGSRNNPSIEHDEETIIEVTDVPFVLASTLVENEPGAYRIVSDQPAPLTTGELALVEALTALAPERLQMILAEVRKCQQ